MSATTDLTVANTIRDQIGKRALLMLGAVNLVGDEKSLSFKVRGCRTITHIRVTLEADDTYTMEFYKCRGINRTLVKSHSQVYADMLNNFIESETGLRTSL